MKLFTGWVVSAGLVLTATAAHAQALTPHQAGDSPYTVVSDVGGPYAAMPQEAPAPGYGPALLPPQEVYTVLRENGFSPLGVPHQRGLVYTIAVIDRGGEDGRLVIDARNGRIVRFMPAYRMGDNFNEGMLVLPYGGPVGAPPSPINNLRGVPRPPAPVPHVASRTPSIPVPTPRPGEEIRPQAARPAPEPAQQSAAIQPKPADAQPAPRALAPAVVEAKPAAPIRPTQDMPKMQGLD
jgi:hypothetical protein